MQATSCAFGRCNQLGWAKNISEQLFDGWPCNFVGAHVPQMTENPTALNIWSVVLRQVPRQQLSRSLAHKKCHFGDFFFFCRCCWSLFSLSYSDFQLHTVCHYAEERFILMFKILNYVNEHNSHCWTITCLQQVSGLLRNETSLCFACWSSTEVNWFIFDMIELNVLKLKSERGEINTTE